MFVVLVSARASSVEAETPAPRPDVKKLRGAQALFIPFPLFLVLLSNPVLWHSAGLKQSWKARRSGGGPEPLNTQKGDMF